MKKMVLMMILGLLIQSMPSRTFACIAPSPGMGGSMALALLGISLFGGNGSTSKAKTGNEFVDLNSNPAFSRLLKQQAGGSLDTLDILK